MGRKVVIRTMKRFLQFSGLIAAVIAIVGFVLLLTCPSLIWSMTIFGQTSTYEYSGIMGIFGGTVTASGSGISIDIGTINPTPSAIIAFILIAAAIVILLLGAILPIAKVKVLNKISGVLNLVALLCLVVGGVLVFVEVPCWCSAQSTADVTVKTDNYTLGSGWLTAGILSCVAGAFAIFPTFANLLAKGKKKRR